jgi:phage terminase large subunit
MVLDPKHLALFQSWADSFAKFIADVLPDFKPSTQQARAMAEVSALVNAKLKLSRGETLTAKEEEYSKKIGVSIMSGKGSGKDTFAALFIIWFLSVFPFPKIPCTAPTGHQLKDVLWSEINKWLRQSKVADWLVWQSDKVFHQEHEGKEWFAVARTCNPRATAEEQAETLAGFHEKFLAVVIDEGSKVPDPVYGALEGTLTGVCNIILLIFNPTRTKGFAVESHGRDRHRWIAIRWNSEESENVSKESVDFMAKKYGRDSNMYRIYVLGLPPLSGEKLLIQWDWADTAIARELEPVDSDPLIFMIDPGAGGDSSVISRRRGPKFFKTEGIDTDDSEKLSNWLARRIWDEEPEVVLVDIIGVGWAIEGNLRRLCPGTRIVGINVAEAAADDTRFYRLRDELCWRVRERFEKREITIDDDPLLIGEMTSLKYDDERTDGKIKVESKKDLKKRGVESPNRFDTLMLSEYYEYEGLRKMAGGKKDNWRGRESGSWRTA